MCSIPVGAEPILNSVGAAPGILVRLSGGGTVLALPGLPEEAQAVLDEALSQLRDLFAQRHLAHREVETPTRDESVLGPCSTGSARSFLPWPLNARFPGFERKDARITVTLEASGPTRGEAELMVEGALRRLIELAGGNDERSPMSSRTFLLIAALMLAPGCDGPASPSRPAITPGAIEATTDRLVALHGEAQADRIRLGVRQVAERLVAGGR